jgi:hypothetical protein
MSAGERVAGRPAPARVLAERVAAVVAVLGALLVAGLGLTIYLGDGSYFLGEASVVLSLDGLSVVETFTGNLLAGGQYFPRVYLLAIRGVRAIFGDTTWATRLLPQLFFLAATVLWMRLLLLRFRRRPTVLVLGVTLLVATATWPIYGAAVKQYTFDAFWVLLLFSVPEGVLEASLRNGQRRGRIVAIALPVALSYTYGVALLARVLGWWVYGARRSGLRVDPRSAATLAASFVGLSCVLWLTDLRHTTGQDGLFLFWRSCILPAPPGESLALLDRFLLGWYEGHVEFMRRTYLPVAVRVALYGALALGVARIVGSVLRRPKPAESSDDERGDRWGSRSVGCLAGVAGAIATSFVLDYPLCSGRLLLYVLWFQQMLLLEGVDQVLCWAARSRAASVAASLAVVALVAVMAVTAVGSMRDLLARVPIEDLRPQLGRLRTAPDLPVIVTSCMEYQVQTLPEGLGMSRVIVQPSQGTMPALPVGEEVWVIHSRLFRGRCQDIHRQFVAVTSDATPRGPVDRGAEVLVYRTRLLRPAEVEEQLEELRRRSRRRARSRAGDP